MEISLRGRIMNKKISVIMGIYNCENTLSEAIESILDQTYTNWELIMCDDGSSDRTMEIANEYLSKYPDEIVLMKNKKNRGLNYTLNKCLKKTKGDYIARMDGDDICSPDRFQKEVAVLNNNDDIYIVSSDMAFFDEKGVWGETNVLKKPTKRDLIYQTPFCHAACMVKKEAFEAVNGYSVNKRFLRVEDYHLWAKMYEKGFYGVNIKENLYMMRDDQKAQNRRKFRYRINEAYVKGYIVKHLKLPKYMYLYCMRPIIVGMLPKKVYYFLHHKNMKGKKL